MKTIDRNLLAEFLLIAFFSVIYLLNLDDLSAIRQGSESLYLGILREMFERDSWLIPFYLGEPHWSKPPLQFFLSLLSCKFFGNFSIFYAKLPIVLISIIGSIYWARWLGKKYGCNRLITLSLFLASFGILKFGRTYMMELLFAILPSISMLHFYNYLQEKNKIYFASSVLLMAFSVLIKGPITLVMAIISLSLFTFFMRFFLDIRSLLKRIGLFFSFSLVLSSLWFIYAYYLYGIRPINVFFFQENLGKFSTNYLSIHRIWQGVLIYGMPATVFIPLFVSRKTINLLKYNTGFIFLFSAFLGFLLVWFIPAQRSLQYAMSSIPFFIALVAVALKVNCDIFLAPSWQWKLSKYLYFGIFLILFLCLICVWIFFANITSIIFSIPVLLLFVYMYISRNKFQNAIVSGGVSIALFYTIVVPTLFLPLVPDRFIDYLTSKDNIALVDRRAFFFSELLGKKVVALNEAKLDDFLLKANSAALVYRTRISSKYLEKNLVVGSWKKWKRIISIDDIIKTLLNFDIRYCQDDVYLITKK